MAQLTLQVDSPSLLEQLKPVLSLMRGVKIVSDSPISRSAALEDVPNAETLAAMKEAESGHDAGVVRVDSLESFMASKERKRKRMVELEQMLRQDYLARTGEEPKFVNVW